MEAAEFDAWYAGSYPRLTRQLYAMIGDRVEAQDCVQEAFVRLPFAQRQAIVLHHLADLPVAQVAAEVGAPEGTVKARLSRGRTVLAALLDEGAHHA